MIVNLSRTPAEFAELAGVFPWEGWLAQDRTPVSERASTLFPWERSTNAMSGEWFPSAGEATDDWWLSPVEESLGRPSSIAELSPVYSSFDRTFAPRARLVAAAGLEVGPEAFTAPRLTDVVPWTNALRTWPSTYFSAMASSGIWRLTATANTGGYGESSYLISSFMPTGATAITSLSYLPRVIRGLTWPSHTIAATLPPVIAPRLPFFPQSAAHYSAQKALFPSGVTQIDVTVPRLPRSHRPSTKALTAVNELRSWLTVSVATLATMLGTSRSSILYWQRTGAEPRPATARRLYRIYALVKALRRGRSDEEFLDLLHRRITPDSLSAFDHLRGGNYSDAEAALRRTLFPPTELTTRKNRKLLDWPEDASTEPPSRGSPTTTSLSHPVQTSDKVRLPKK